MLSVLVIVSLVAGICYGQDVSKYSDCDTLDRIATGCAGQDLDYVKDLDNMAYMQLKQISRLDSLELVMGQLDFICNDTMQLKNYYECIFSNVTTCLNEKNSSQAKKVPDTKTISMGIVELCESKEDVKSKCFLEKAPEVGECLSKMTGDASKEQCSGFKELLECAEKLGDCEGSEAIKGFIISARPNVCPYSSSAPQFLSSALLVMGILLAHIIRFQ
ncbi:uncharacterized protein LOC143292538 [Babylonia areolata]|uniref:uncharacterized protein LOC143292538 n=1 Tax=Babylonia areolata TaxID=304850 RepID=UPI003FD0DEA5